jgi:hypothetical protein
MINIITSLSRYNNIEIIYSSIKHQTDNFIWHLIEGTNATGEASLDFLKEDARVKFYKIETSHFYGYEQRNYFITNIGADDNDWCYWLDDDNIVTHDLITTCEEYQNTDVDFILFSQKAGLTEKIRLHGDGIHRLKMGSFDTGSFAMKYKMMKKTFIHYFPYHNGDGAYAESIAPLSSEHKFLYCPDKFVRYNALSLRII